ncbi:MAG: sulfotransferase [Cyclobacteriaceae bacterium]
MKRPRPIFIGGVPRSGTTILGSILGNMPNCFTTPESTFKNQIVKNGNINNRVIKKINNTVKFKAWDVGQIEGTGGMKDTKYIVEEIIQRYKQKKKIGDDRFIWIDHTPENFKIFSHLIKLFPEASFINIIRDPRAVIASVKKLTWGPNNVYTAINWWYGYMIDALTAHNCHSHKVFQVRYEDLVEDSPIVIQRICNKIDVPFNKESLDGDASFLPEFTKSQHALVGSKLNKSRITGWNKELNNFEVSYIEKRLWNFMRCFGYETVSRNFNYKLNFLNKTYYFIENEFLKTKRKLL